MHGGKAIMSVIYYGRATCVLLNNLWFGGPSVRLCLPTKRLCVLFNLEERLANAGLTVHNGSFCPRTIMCGVY